MKLYTSTGAPNPRRVAIFLAEKGISLPTVDISIMNLEHLSDGFASVNPLRRLPVLELDDGTRIAESIAICRYFEEVQPDPPLFGIDLVDRAVVEMWQRRIEINFMAAVAFAFRHLHPKMAVLEKPQVPEWGEANKPKAIKMIEWLDQELADRRYIAGDRYSVADITLLVAIDFMKPARLEIPVACENIQRWYGEVSARPSASA